MATYLPIVICIAIAIGPLTNGFQPQKSENPIPRNEPRIMTRQQTTPDSRETFMQRILAKIQGPSAPPPLSTPKPFQPQVLQPSGYQYQLPPPHFVYRYPPPYFRREKGEKSNANVNDSISVVAETPNPVVTTLAPPVTTSTEKSVPPPRFYRGPQSESDSISIPILRSDIQDIQDYERKAEQTPSHAPKCYVSQKSLIPLPPVPLPLYNTFGYGFPFGYQHLQPNAFPGGNHLLPISPYTRYPIIYFVLPKKKPVHKEPFDLIAMEENKVVIRPVAAPTRKPVVEIDEPSFVEVTSEPTMQGTLEKFSPMPSPKPTPVVESSIEEIVEIDVDPVSKLLDILTGTSHEPTSKEKQEKDLINLSTLRPNETDVVRSNSDVKSHLKTVDATEIKEDTESSTATSRQRSRKFNLKRF